MYYGHTIYHEDCCVKKYLNAVPTPAYWLLLFHGNQQYSLRTAQQQPYSMGRKSAAHSSAATRCLMLYEHCVPVKARDSRAYSDISSVVKDKTNYRKTRNRASCIHFRFIRHSADVCVPDIRALLKFLGATRFLRILLANIVTLLVGNIYTRDDI